MIRPPVAAAAGVLVVCVAVGSYAAGHHAGAADGRRAGARTAMAGLSADDLDLLRGLSADRAAGGASPSPTATPSPSLSFPSPAGTIDCERGNAMPKIAQCEDPKVAPGSALSRAPTTQPRGPVAGLAAAPALQAAKAYVRWLQAHPTSTTPLAVSRLRTAADAMPPGATLGLLADTDANGSDDDGLVQVAAGGDLSCVRVATLSVTPGGCYANGNKVQDLGGYYTPKRFTPGYANQL